MFSESSLVSKKKMVYYTRNVTFIAQYWLVQGTDWSVICMRKSGLFYNRTKMS